MKQRARSDEEKQAKKEIILDAARILFSRNGYQGTTIEMITDEAHLSPAAFYLYFKNKTEIYRTLTAMGIDILGKIVMESIMRPDMSPSDKIKGIADAYFTYFNRHREFYNITEILHLGQGDFFADLNMVPDLENKATDMLKLIASIIQEGIDTGEFHQVDVWKSAVALWGMIDGVLLLEVKKTTSFVNEPIENLVTQMITLVLEGLFTKNAQRK